MQALDCLFVILVLSLTSCVILGKLLDLSIFQFTHLLNGGTNNANILKLELILILIRMTLKLLNVCYMLITVPGSEEVLK